MSNSIGKQSNFNPIPLTQTHIGLGVCIGVVLGTSLGILIDQVTLAVALGSAMGALISTSLFKSSDFQLADLDALARACSDALANLPAYSLTYFVSEWMTQTGRSSAMAGTNLP